MSNFLLHLQLLHAYCYAHLASKTWQKLASSCHLRDTHRPNETSEKTFREDDGGSAPLLL